MPVVACPLGSTVARTNWIFVSTPLEPGVPLRARKSSLRISTWLRTRAFGTLPPPVLVRITWKTTWISITSRLAGEYAVVGLVVFEAQSPGGAKLLDAVGSVCGVAQRKNPWGPGSCPLRVGTPEPGALPSLT